MKKNIIVTMVLALTMFYSPLFAKEEMRNIYIGFNGTYKNTEANHHLSRDNFYKVETYKHDNYGVEFKAGMDIFKWLAIEGRISRGLTSHLNHYVTDLNSPYTLDFSSKWGMGCYIKPQFMFTDNFKVYGVLGYVYNIYEIEKITPNFHGTIDEGYDGVAFGLGCSYYVTSSISLDMEYNRQEIKDVTYSKTGAKISSELDVDNYILGVSYYF